MKFRTVSMGGKFNIDSIPGEGTIIHIEIPMHGKMVLNRVIFN
jgi:signal transduction histidine kinase